jgi:hypothetical protein
MPEQVARDHPVRHLQHRRYQLGVRPAADAGISALTAPTDAPAHEG